MKFIKKTGKYVRLRFYQKPADIPADTAIVYIHKSGNAISSTIKCPLSRAELASKSLTDYYEIELKRYSIDFCGEYEDDEQLDKFSVDIECSYFVNQPDVFIESLLGLQHNDDIDFQLKKRIENKIKRTARKYSAKDKNQKKSFAAEIDKREFIEDIEEEMHKMGIEVKGFSALIGKSKENIEIQKEENKNQKLFDTIQKIYNENGREGLRRYFIGNNDLYEKVCALLEKEQQDYKDNKENLIDFMKVVKELDYDLDTLNDLSKFLPKGNVKSVETLKVPPILKETDEDDLD